MKRTVLLTCLVVFGAATLVLAQASTTGTVMVVVEATDGSRLPGATVTAAADDVATRRTAVADSQGQALLLNLTPSPNYIVTTELSGFTTTRNERILVRSGQQTSLTVALPVSSQTEEITVTADTPLVDTTSAVQGTDITLELTESLPTGRSYQSYLQLVPGVMPSETGNPASKSGLNYSDIGGTVGQSSDNFYYFDGINVTDPVTGTFGANLNTEIIQEQKVITGGIPAEFAGTPGLLSNAILKSGSNNWRGSINYFTQNDGLVAENENGQGAQFSTWESAATLGGPIVKDRAWFFGSFRRIERDDDVTTLDTNELIRSVTNSQDQGYFKATWAPSDKDTLTATFLNDPTEISGSRLRTTTNARDRSQKQGGSRYSANYSRLLGSAIVDLGYAKHNGEVSSLSVIRESANAIIFRATDTRTLADEQDGGAGSDLINQRDTETYRGSLQWNLGRHTLKAGVEHLSNDNHRNSLTIGPTSSSYSSLSNGLAGISALDVTTAGLTLTRFDPTNPSDYDGFITTVNGLPNRASFYSAFDLNGDGVISQAELGAALTYSTPNPEGGINYDRSFQSAVGPQDTGSKGLSFFVQDSVQFGRFTANLGLRTERFEHFNTLGDNIYTFDWTMAPRLSLVYDVLGNGKQKATAYFGRYYDPIRNNMTNFAGSHSGSTNLEQVFANGEWVTYRTRGGASLDAIFAPETKTPYTDDLQVGYQIDLGKSMAFDVLYTKRWTRDILEDYDPHLYSDPSVYPGPIDHPDSLFLPYEHFGFAPTGLPGVANFFIGTLEGGERDYQGVELTLRRRHRNNWQGLIAYTYNDMKGNTNSDSNADFQGDVLFLDPRAPNQYGPQPGSIKHIFKAAGSYQFPFGLQLGGFYRWNSGTLASRTFRASGRNLPIRVLANETFEFAGINQRWIAPNTVGALTNPSFGILDLRVQYNRRFGNVGAELFVDMFNVLNNQEATHVQDLVAGTGGVAFGQGLNFSDPRRAFLGARLSF